MRIFIHNVDTYLGRILVNELRKAEGGNHRVFGTVKSKPDKAPSVVKRIVSREDPKRTKKMIETIQSCRVVVIDLFSSSLEDLHFLIKALKVDPTSSPPKPTGDLEGEVTFVLVSSLLVWAGTRPSTEGGVLKESDYQHRAPVSGSKYEQWKEMEDLVMSCFNREGSTVKALVVAGGALYGEGEETFGPIFKNAWCGIKGHVIVGKGANHVPTVHVRDLARLVRHVASDSSIVAAETPYFIAVDQPPPASAEEGARPLPPTQAGIVQGVVDEMCEPYEVPHVAEWPQKEDEAEQDEEEQTGDLRDTLMMDLRVETSPLMLQAEFASINDPSGWYCREGLLHNLRKIADEFCKERNLRAMRVLIAGPPASGKSTLCQAVADHFRIPHHELRGDGPPEEMAEVLASRVCRYRGYVLDAGLVGFAEVERLFRFDVELPPVDGDDEPPPPPPPAADDGGDGDGAPQEEPPPKQYERRLHEEICPSFVVVTQAPKGLCEGRWRQARGNFKESVDEFKVKMELYASSNLTEGVHSLADFFQEIARSSVFNLPIAGKDEEDMFESTRIYMERDGRPFNYLPTGEEVAAHLLARYADLERQAADREADERSSAEVAKAQELRAEGHRHAERLQIVLAHQQEQKKLKELPLRDYLMEYMIPCLTEGLIEVCKVLPDNPTDYLANYLEDHAAQGGQENVH